MLREPQSLNCLLVKPAGPDCNLRCSYCFYLRKGELFGRGAHRMDEETLAILTRRSLERAHGAFSFIWQGGEPTLMGLPFFEKAMGLQRHYGDGLRISNALQTNATLVDADWAVFFKANDFLVGVSLDGDEHVHDHHRVDTAGRGTWRTVSANARLLLGAGVAANAVACVSAYSAPYAAETYAFLKETGFDHMQFIPVVEPDGNGGVTDFSVSPEAYGEFLCTLFDAWRADFKDGRPSTSIRLFDTLFFTLLGHPAPECDARGTCGLYLAVEHTGDVYPCDFFIEPAHHLGNIREHHLHDLFNSRRQRLFGGAKAQLTPTCKACRWLPLCGGGCLKDRRNNPAGFKMSYFCTSMTRFLPHAVPTLKGLASRWRG
ncbi:MAG: anaerobic sulfatase maturase [Desulfovibrionaceae bacterium]|jgi:uncharacterized protein|nr:anaerobic sulfatase maturase [Desulfovibrionaceae bacterium]